MHGNFYLVSHPSISQTLQKIYIFFRFSMRKIITEVKKKKKTFLAPSQFCLSCCSLHCTVFFSSFFTKIGNKNNLENQKKQNKWHACSDPCPALSSKVTLGQEHGKNKKIKKPQEARMLNHGNQKHAAYFSRVLSCSKHCTIHFWKKKMQEEKKI